LVEVITEPSDNTIYIADLDSMAAMKRHYKSCGSYYLSTIQFDFKHVHSSSKIPAISTILRFVMVTLTLNSSWIMPCYNAIETYSITEIQFLYMNLNGPVENKTGICAVEITHVQTRGLSQ
jgi:hypothetical protein